MFGIGGFNPISLLATTALGPVGGIFAQLAQQVISQFGQQLLQQIGDQMSLPQSTIDVAQGLFAASHGDFQGGARNLDEALSNFGQATGASPSQIGEAQRTMGDFLKKQAAEAVESEEAKEAKAGGRGGGWLRALAAALGEAADKGAANLEQQAAGLDNAKPSETAAYQADAQAFSMLMNAITQVIKSIGEALSSLARNQ